MVRKISVAGKSYALELLSTPGDGDVRFRLDSEEEGGASVIEVMPRVYSVLIAGRSYEARVVSDGGEVVIEIEGERYPVVIEDPRRVRRSGAERVGEDRATVKAPMPGKIVRVLAKEGAEVHAGEGLVVIEAMKMQNEMKAPRAGRLVSLPVRDGETVTAGAVLAVVE